MHDLAARFSQSLPGFRRRRAAAPLLALLALAAPGPGPTPGAAGRIEGVAVLAPRLTSRHQRVRIYAEPGASETAPRPAEPPLENVVLYLESAPAGPGPDGPAPEMHQHGERFVPHVLPVLAGSTVAFPNDDPIYHNVFSLSSARSFDLGRFGQGQSRSIIFPKPGVVQVFCHIHADMSGYVLVLRNRFFTKPDSAGRFALDGVPEGSYKLIAWHERIRPITIPVQVTSGGITTVSVAIPLLSPDST